MLSKGLFAQLYSMRRVGLSQDVFKLKVKVWWGADGVLHGLPTCLGSSERRPFPGMRELRNLSGQAQCEYCFEVALFESEEVNSVLSVGSYLLEIITGAEKSAKAVDILSIIEIQERDHHFVSEIMASRPGPWSIMAKRAEEVLSTRISELREFCGSELHREELITHCSERSTGEIVPGEWLGVMNRNLQSSQTRTVQEAFCIRELENLLLIKAPSAVLDFLKVNPETWAPVAGDHGEWSVNALDAALVLWRERGMYTSLQAALEAGEAL